MILLLMAVTVGALLLVGHSIWPVAVLLNLWELLATAAPTGWWTWIARTLPENAEAGKGLMVAVIQLAIALDSTAGRDFRHSGMASSLSLSGLLLPGVAAMTIVTSRQYSQAVWHNPFISAVLFVMAKAES